MQHDAAHDARIGTHPIRSPASPFVICETFGGAILPIAPLPVIARAASRTAIAAAPRARSMQPAWVMMSTVRDTFSSIGDRGGEIARNVGCGTAELARRVGSGTADIARQIGPRRALIGLAIAAVAIGGSILVVRYLRARRERDDLGVDLDEDLAAASRIRPTEDRAYVPGTDVRPPL